MESNIKRLQINIGFLSKAICIAGFLFWAVLLIKKFYYFGYYDWDLALYDQVVWNICHGQLVTSLIGANFLADHAHFIAFLIASIYCLFPHPLTLIILKIFSFFCGAFIFYKIACEFLDEGTSLILMILYIIHPANIFMLLYEFHFESLAIGLIFLLFYYFLKDRWKSFMITAIVLILVKENMPLILVMFGLWGLVAKKGERLAWGIIPFFLGLGFFMLTMFVIIPFVRKDLPVSGSVYWTLYSHVGASPSNILQNFLIHPLKIVRLILFGGNLSFIYNLFGVFFVFAWGAPQILFLSFPILLQNLLSNNSAQHTIYYHYAATILPFIAVASAVALSGIRKNYSPMLHRLFWILSIFVLLHTSFLAWPDLDARIERLFDSRAKYEELIVQSIPPEAGVISTFSFLDHLSHHQNLYAFYNLYKGINYFTGQRPFKVPSSVDYALIDFKDLWLEGEFINNYDSTTTRISKFLNSQWKIQMHYKDVFLYKRKKI